jgi:hypothetical protein
LLECSPPTAPRRSGFDSGRDMSVSGPLLKMEMTLFKSLHNVLSVNKVRGSNAAMGVGHAALSRLFGRGNRDVLSRAIMYVYNRRD